MVTITLAQLAKKLDKTITDIAEETGINRNTITALVHNKVDGIKFSTLEKICATYGIGIADLLEIAQPSDDERADRPYKQEGSIVPFTAWPWVIAINYPNRELFSVDFTKLSIFFKEKYGQAYWDYRNFYKVAETSYRRYRDINERKNLYNQYLQHANLLRDVYFTTDPKQIISSTPEELSEFLGRLWKMYADFFTYCIFIDSFDAGFDQEEISRIAKRYDLSVEEIGVLTTPEQPTFNNDRELALVKIAKLVRTYFAKEVPTKENVTCLLTTNPAVEEYRKNFDYYMSNYAQVKHISLDDVVDGVMRYLADSDLMESEYARLANYSKEQRRKVQALLKTHRLTTNPLDFFQDITYWREHRKQMNLMGIHLLDSVLRSIEEKSGIAYKYLQFLSYEEVDGAMKGLVTKETLKKRREQGVIITCGMGSYKVIEGPEAISLRDELEYQLRDGEVTTLDLKGHVASQGYAKGIARIIIDQSDFHKLGDGEILVTGMTRPEFVPVMKRAAAIVTNEGGITCHAAIISRELGKPCIIGTKNATQVIKDGDLIEVRANHGTVRILQQ